VLLRAKVVVSSCTMTRQTRSLATSPNADKPFIGVFALTMLAGELFMHDRARVCDFKTGLQEQCDLLD